MSKGVRTEPRRGGKDGGLVGSFQRSGKTRKGRPIQRQRRAAAQAEELCGGNTREGRRCQDAVFSAAVRCAVPCIATSHSTTKKGQKNWASRTNLICVDGFALPVDVIIDGCVIGLVALRVLDSRVPVDIDQRQSGRLQSVSRPYMQHAHFT